MLMSELVYPDHNGHRLDQRSSTFMAYRQNSGQNPPTTDENPSKWTPAKQMEHELTRNRMKKLLRKRRKTTILSNNSLPRSPGSVIW
ncbi:hypothetical protein ANCDUO_00481 [Ancylostoma duodenale]|uniref:Uncharacterized protein n=1 Tax=Ancylostoma duodenale TaxID=51022 RepID=A0A0C2HBY8_9BILA|nr:hypothetical protein ANCDUO_00481 [Ancylostoma duodenale]